LLLGVADVVVVVGDEINGWKIGGCKKEKQQQQQ